MVRLPCMAMPNQWRMDNVRVQPLLCWHRVNPIKLQMPITRLRSCPRLGESLRPFVPLLSQTILAEFGASPFKFRPNPLRLRAVPHRENSCNDMATSSLRRRKKQGIHAKSTDSKVGVLLKFSRVKYGKIW